MADNIKLITYAESNVTPQHDALMADLELPGNGIIFGAQVTIKNATTLHINAGVGVIYGREFEIIDSDITVPLSQSGTLQGQLYVHIELANSQEPAQLLVQTGTSLDPLADNPQMNIDTGTSDMQLATFTIDTSTLADLTQTFTTLESVSGEIESIKSDLSDSKGGTSAKFQFATDGAGTYGYVNANNEFQAFGGGDLETKCKLKSACFYSFHTNMVGGYPGAITLCNDDGTYYSNYASNGTSYFIDWMSKSDLVKSCRAASNTLYVTLAKSGYYMFGSKMFSNISAPPNPTLYNAGDEVAPGNGGSILYYGVSLPS